MKTELLVRVAQGLAWRLQRWADVRRLKKVEQEISKHPDCLATIQVVNSHIQAEHLCDVGSFKGHWSYIMYRVNPKLKSVVMFEPQAKYAAELRDRKFSGVVKRIYQCALGDRDSRISIKGGTASASLYDASDIQHHYFPQSVHDECEEIDVRSLDDIYKKDGLEYPDLIKIDVQGYELNVLKGAREVLKNARYLVIELSMREFYKGQPPLWELLRHLEEEQYVLVDHGYELRSSRSPQELLQFDAILKNRRFE